MKYMRKLHPYLDILVSNIGEVFVPATKGHPAHWTFGSKHSDGYRVVGIGGNNYKVHRLVLETFVGPCPEGFECNHKSRDRSDNRLENLEWVTHQDNQRNTSQHDQVVARGGTHKYEDARQYSHEQGVRYYAENRDAVHEQQASYRQSKRKTHRVVNFSDGSQHWVSLPEAEAYLIIPLKQRTFKH